MSEPSSTESGALKVADGATLSTVTESEYSSLSPPSSSRTWPRTSTLPLSLVGQAWVADELQSVHVEPPSQLKRYSCVSALPGSTTSLSERLMSEPSLTESGALNVALGATFVTVTDALYAFAPRSLSRICPSTLRVPLSSVGHECSLLALQSVQVPPPSQLKRYSKPAAVSAEEGSLGLVSERSIAEPSSTESGALKVAVGATFSTETDA